MVIRTYGNFYTHLLHIICFLCVAGERTTIDQRNIKHLLYIPGYNMISGSIYNQVVEIQDNYNVKSNNQNYNVIKLCILLWMYQQLPNVYLKFSCNMTQTSRFKRYYKWEKLTWACWVIQIIKTMFFQFMSKTISS